MKKENFPKSKKDYLTDYDTSKKLDWWRTHSLNYDPTKFRKIVDSREVKKTQYKWTCYHCGRQTWTSYKCLRHGGVLTIDKIFEAQDGFCVGNYYCYWCMKKH